MSVVEYTKNSIHQMKRIGFLLSLATMFAALTACDDDTTTVGSTLVTDSTEIVVDSAFTVTGMSVENKSVQSRTITQLIGKLNARGYGRFSSEIVTQFMPTQNIDTTGVSLSDIDSMKLVMFFYSGDFTGDSLVPMGLQVFPLTKQLPSPIYSNFDPTGYYNPNEMWQSQIYTGNALYSDSANELSYRSITVDLPVSFAKQFYSEYKQNPATFATPQAFAKFFPGLYIRNSFGDGRVTDIFDTRINLYFRSHQKVTVNDVETDTIYNLVRTYMAVTPEVVTNNIIRLDMSDNLTSRVSGGKTLLVAPAGLDIEMKFPIEDVIASYRRNAGTLSVINTLTLSIPAEEIENDYDIEVPLNILMVLKKEKDEFFDNNSLCDNETSFLATYNSSTNSYNISNMRQYLLNMIEKGSLTAEDYTFVITPVNVETESTSDSYYQSGTTYTTAITPYVSGPKMVQLNLEDAKIKLTFSKQSANF